MLHTESVATNARRPVSVTFGQKFSKLLSKSELRSLLLSDLPRVSRKIELIILHCTDTKPKTNYKFEQLCSDHAKRGFGEYPGYHLYVKRDGTLYYCRPLYLKGCHVTGYNAISIGVCTEGGHRQDAPYPSEKEYVEYKASGRSFTEDNRTAEQLVVLHDLLMILHEMFPLAKIVGHHDLNPGKACPCYDAAKEYAYITAVTKDTAK